MRPFHFNATNVPRRFLEVPAAAQSTGVAPNGGTPEAQADVARLVERLRPSDAVSRRAFLGAGPVEPETLPVSLRTFIGLVVSGWVLDRSLDLASINHKSSAADDVARGRDLARRFAARHPAPRRGEPDVMWRALEISFTGTGTCGRHAARNFVLIGAALRGIRDEFPLLRDHLPTVEMVSDPRAGSRLGGPTDDVHVYVVVRGDGDPLVVDSWVTFPRIGTVDEGLCRADVVLCRFDANRDDGLLPDDALQQIDAAVDAGWEEPGAVLLDDARYADPAHWQGAGGQRLRGWQTLSATRDDTATVYTCGELRFDPDLMSADGLATRKRWVQEATHALAVGGQSPIRDAPAFSPLRRGTEDTERDIEATDPAAPANSNSNSNSNSSDSD